ncbi:hypothetical protein FIBSPDRAFT_887619 [Athelia psychrophila]|uniref:DUF6593 domain-containing protein n=1 Tax=Athelia psychrophila TaxID=1759441 RepID=A0A166PBS3_9AGAM|nr:hypothetical protein FIBSPDRAFT_887619 [Fibularhizoctonia sp. CBS 109695]
MQLILLDDWAFATVLTDSSRRAQYKVETSSTKPKTTTISRSAKDGQMMPKHGDTLTNAGELEWVKVASVEWRGVGPSNWIYEGTETSLLEYVPDSTGKSKMQVAGSDGRAYAWKKSGKDFALQSADKTVKPALRIATYYPHKYASIPGPGKLDISPEAEHMVELVVISFLVSACMKDNLSSRNNWLFRKVVGAASNEGWADNN